MCPKLKDFEEDWNKAHRLFAYAFFYGPGVKHPTGVEVRYSAAKYRHFLYGEGTWDTLKTLIEAKSQGTLLVATDEWLFQRGVLEIKIASYSHNYEEERIIDVLRWLGDDFFGNPD